MTGGDLFAGSRVVHILDAEFTEHQAPISLRFLGKIRDYIFVYPGCLIKFTRGAQPVSSRKQRHFLFVIGGGNGLLCSAVLALRNGHAVLNS